MTWIRERNPGPVWIDWSIKQTFRAENSVKHGGKKSGPESP